MTSKTNLEVLFLLISLFSCMNSSLSSQDNMVLGVQTTMNKSAQISEGPPTNEQKLHHLENSNMKESPSREEIHSSFEHFDESKSNEHSQSDVPLHLQHNQANIATRLSESGQAAVVYTLTDSATEELRKQAAVLPVPASKNENGTGPLTISLSLADEQENDTQSQYIVRAEPRPHVQAPTIPQPPVASHENSEGMGVADSELAEENNDTLTSAQTDPPSPPSHQEDIPSFSEWAQKQLAEAEKKKGENVTGGSSVTAPMKVRHSKNYASPDCGAKVVGANPEAVSAGSVLTASRDEYLLNTCNARIWFIVELCEAVQPKKFEMANYELFSSSPREFSVWLSDRHPTRDWVLAGRWVAQDERTLQAFNLTSAHTHFGKYVKVEIHSHYGQEHYCPVSLFRVYGTSEIEVLDTVEEGLHMPSVEEDEDESVGGGEGGDAPRNLFGSARDAVLSIVKKAAEALAKSPEEESRPVTGGERTAGLAEPCVTPGYLIVCVNCSEDFYHKVYQLMSCRSQWLDQLLSSAFLRQAVASSELCAERGLDLRVGAPFPSRPGTRHRPIDYLQALLPPDSLAALCNFLAVAEKKVVLNVSRENALSMDASVTETDGAELTPVLPDSCTADVNVSEQSAGITTQQPYEPPQPHTLPIRPSRTMRSDQDVDLATDAAYSEANVTQTSEVVAEPAAPVTPPNHNNMSPPNTTAGSPATDPPPLVVEDSGSLDLLFSELELAVVPSPRIPPAPQKESVFVRLANRIKALERNMSLSSQYLEELSRRYKRQVEEMQRALAGTVEDRRRNEERDGLRLEQMAQLTQQVEALTMAVNSLLDERDSWQHKATVMGQHGVIVLVEVVVFALVLYVCRWFPEVEVKGRKFSVAWPLSVNRGAGAPTRRKSVDEVLAHAPTCAKRRRPSEEALVIAGNTHHELLIPEARRKISKGEKRQRRKKKREQAHQVRERREEKPSLLDVSSESVAGWWEEEANFVSAPAPAPQEAQAEPPRYVQTAVAQRQERIARTSNETSDKENKLFLPIKKTGPFKKIVKKFF